MSAGRFTQGGLIFAAWLVPSLLSGFSTFAQDRLDGRAPDWRWVVFNSIDWLLYAVLTPWVFAASRRFRLEPPRRGRHIALHVAGALLMCVAWAGMGSVLRLMVFPIEAAFSFEKYLLGLGSWILTTLPFGTGVYFALVGIEHSFYYFAQARERETQAARLEAQLSEARLNALRMQLHPHFLFNSLNAITVLVRDQETGAATRMLGLLSDVLRQVLRAEPAQEVALQAEVEFLERYLAIEQVRFSDRLRPRMEIAPEVQRASVPSFLLQPLVENAVRHGIAKRADAGLVEVRARREGGEVIITVRDDGPGLPPRGVSADPFIPGGVGLSNTRGRLAALYGSAASLTLRNAEDGGVVAEIRMPFREVSSL